MSNTKFKQLNMLEIMGLRRSHYHKSIDSTYASDITIPTVDANQQYDSPTISRVTKQFANNIGRLTSYIKENAETLKTTNLASYITTNPSDEDGMNKIFVSSPCAMTSKRTLDLKNCMDLRPNNMPENNLIASFMFEEFSDSSQKVLIGITTKLSNDTHNQIIRIPNITQDIQLNTQVIYDPLQTDEPNNDAVFKRAGFADANKQYIYIITNKDIRLFKTAELCNLNVNAGITFSHIIDFKNSYSDDHKRYNDNLVIEDIYKRPNKQIADVISSGDFHSFVDKYFMLGEFPKNVLTPSSFSLDPRIVYDVGIATGKWGAYLIHCYSCKPKNINEFEIDENQNVRDANGNPVKTGSLHIRCLDNKPVKDAFFYEDNGKNFLVLINGWPQSDSDYARNDNKYNGVTVLQLDEASAASISYDIPERLKTLDFKNSFATPVPSNGYLTTSQDKDVKININQILDSRGINGSYINHLWYKDYSMTIDGIETKGFALKYLDWKNNEYYWFINWSDLKLFTVTKVYDRHEFNCLSEYKIQHALYNGNTLLLEIKGIGLVLGTKERDKNNNTGFRFHVLRKESEYEKLNSLVVMNRCFVAISEKILYFIISDGSCQQLKLGTDISSNVKTIQYSCTYESSNILCIGEGANIAIIYLKYKVDTKEYSDAITKDISELISANFLSRDNIIAKEIDKHILSMHTSDSIVNKLNSIFSKMENKSIMQSTEFTENQHISYIILNYPNSGEDFSYVETDENSTNIYGRINSQTINANPTFMTLMKRNSNTIAYYDTVQDENGKLFLTTNKVVYSVCKLSDYMTRLSINVPSTGTFYVDNILGWSGGSRTGSTLLRKNLNGGYLQGQIENCTTRYQLVLNRVFFNIKNIINVTAQITSAPLKIYSNTQEFDIRHYGMYDSPVIAPLNLNSMGKNFTYDMSNITNDEIVLGFSIFGGDALQINILIENNEV